MILEDDDMPLVLILEGNVPAEEDVAPAATPPDADDPVNGSNNEGAVAPAAPAPADDDNCCNSNGNSSGFAAAPPPAPGVTS